MRIKIKAADIVAVVVVIACTYLLCHGIDTIVGYSLLAVVTGYFGLEVTLPHIGKRKGGKR
ncbi:MAG: hypothetical protein A2Y74_01535 [Actinobacteria bacterium RBG_13_63_9]|nr:MAG: hypothetical protein A2Y74_01535 [Actinobacteria bacterium RBG_13_63_9]